MDTQLLDAIRLIMQEELKTFRKEAREEFRSFREEIRVNLDTFERKLNYRLAEQDRKLDIMLEGWQVQKTHRDELNDHEERITILEHHVPTIR